MKDELILAALRAQASLPAVALAELLDELTGGGLHQGSMIMYFHRAFPGTPLPILLEAGGWHRLSDGGMTDEEFNALLRPWLDRVDAC